jgi:hypothetical protein
LDSLVANPYALEAVERLAILGTEKSHVVEAVTRGFKQNGYDQSLVPMKELISSHFAEHRHQTAPALHLFTKLEKQFPNNVYLLLKIATLMVRNFMSRTMNMCMPLLILLDPKKLAP